MQRLTSRQPGFALVEFVGLARHQDESLTVLVSRVPCIGEEVQIESDPAQRVRRVCHRLHPKGIAPGDDEVDAVIELEPLPGDFTPPRRHSVSTGWR